MILPTPEQQEYIEGIIATRLEYSVDYPHVLRWLDNFDDTDQEKAIQILSKLEYYSDNKVLGIIQDGLNNAIKPETGQVFIMPIGKPGKSGGLIQYSCHQILNSTNKVFFINNLDEATSGIESKNDLLILVDDIIGSGGTLCNWLKAECQKSGYGIQLQEMICQSQVCVLGIVVMEKGLKHIRNIFPTIPIYAEIRRKAFLHVGSQFGGSVKMREIREMCYKYGKTLYRRNPLGFENTQALIVFHHASPNNTLPIIWANTRINEDKHWYPLYPRFAPERINLSKESLKSKRKHLVQLHELFGYDEVTSKLFAATNLYLLEMLTHILRNEDEFTIVQSMGLPNESVSELWKEGIRLGLWDDKHQVTESCKKRYDEINKEIQFKRTEERLRKYKTSALIEEHLYIPETFRGVR